MPDSPGTTVQADLSIFTVENAIAPTDTCEAAISVAKKTP